MIRRLLIAALLAMNTAVCFGQLSVYYCNTNNEVGWAVGLDNAGGVRNNAAYKHCIQRGGASPFHQNDYDGPGCYAVVSGVNDKGGKVFGWVGNSRTREDAINLAKSAAQVRGAVGKSLSVIASGCVEAPPKPAQQVPAKQVPVWSEWHSEACPYLEYRTKTLEGYDWNYQVHIYVEVRSKFKMPVSYVFELVDGDGKTHFGDLHKNDPGETIDFVHKMSKKIIKKIRIKDLRNAQTNKPTNCDQADGGKAANDAAVAAKHNDLQEAIAAYNRLLPDVPEGHTKNSTTHIVQDVLSKPGYTTDYKLSVVNKAINDLRSYINQSGGKAAVSAGLRELTDKEVSLVNDIRSIDPNAKAAVWEGGPYDNGDYTIARKKENISRLEKQLSDLNGKLAAEKVAKEREKENFSGLMQKGNDAMNSKDYTRAMSSYQAAMNGTSDPDDKALASARYNVALEAKKTADREVRVAEAKQRDKEEDALYSTAAVAAVGAMALLKDRYSSRAFAAKFLLGAGYERSPILSNGSGKSYIEERNLLTLHLGFDLGLLNNRAVSFYIKPQVNAGMSAFASGTSGGYASYGASGVLQLATKKHSKFNVFGEGGWFKHSGTFKYDADARNNTATDEVREGNMSFSKLHYGGGFMLRWINADAGKETYLRPGVFFEQPSFFDGVVKPVLSMNLQVYIYSAILLDLTYTHNTYIAGELTYPATLEKKNVSSYGVKIIRKGRLY